MSNNTGDSKINFVSHEEGQKLKGRADQPPQGGEARVPPSASNSDWPGLQPTGSGSAFGGNAGQRSSMASEHAAPGPSGSAFGGNAGQRSSMATDSATPGSSGSAIGSSTEQRFSAAPESATPGSSSQVDATMLDTADDQGQSAAPSPPTFHATLTHRSSVGGGDQPSTSQLSTMSDEQKEALKAQWIRDGKPLCSVCGKSHPPPHDEAFAQRQREKAASFREKKRQGREKFAEDKKNETANIAAKETRRAAVLGPQNAGIQKTRSTPIATSTSASVAAAAGGSQDNLRENLGRFLETADPSTIPLLALSMQNVAERRSAQQTQQGSKNSKRKSKRSGKKRGDDKPGSEPPKRNDGSGEGGSGGAANQTAA